MKVGELWREHLNLGLILPLHGPFHIVRKLSYNMRHMNKILKCLTNRDIRPVHVRPKRFRPNSNSSSDLKIHGTV